MVNLHNLSYTDLVDLQQKIIDCVEFSHVEGHYTLLDDIEEVIQLQKFLWNLKVEGAEVLWGKE